MNYAELTDDELRLEVARRCGKRLELDRSGRFWLECLPDGTRRVLPYYCTDLAAAIALLDGMTYPDGVSVEYNIGKETRYSGGNLLPPGCIVYVVTIWGHNPIHCDDYEATADTLPRAACVAWLMWDDARKEAQHDNS